MEPKLRGIVPRKRAGPVTAQDAKQARTHTLLANLTPNTGRHVCYEKRDDAARVASAGPTSVTSIIRCDRGCKGRRWRLVTCEYPGVTDAIMPSIDVLRSTSPEKWESVYTRLAAEYPATSILDGSGLHGDPTKNVTIHRGAWYWRTWYGVPRRTKKQLLDYHCSMRRVWDLRANDVVDSVPAELEPYRSEVRRICLAAASAFARKCASAGRDLDAERMSTAILHPDFDVRILGPKSNLHGALFPCNSLRYREGNTSMCPMEEAYDDNRRILAIQLMRPRARLMKLLAHELAHALMPPLWLPENHPAAFVAAEEEMALAISSIRGNRLAAFL
jgi:hypothetical protein